MLLPETLVMIYMKVMGRTHNEVRIDSLPAGSLVRVRGKVLAAEPPMGRERVTFPRWMAALPPK